MNSIIFGSPGAGKGTYSRRLHDRLGIAVISTGDIFRKNIADDTELGKKVKRILDSGGLVPDETTNEILKNRLEEPDTKTGFILDGYPRTVPQAEFLGKITQIDAILNLIVPDEILIEKMSARRVCEKCGDIYNIADINREVDGVRYILPPMSPKAEGRCDKCGSDIIQRLDDSEGVIKNRLEVYKKQSKPIMNYYKGKVLFVDIHVTRGPDVMVDKIIEMLKEKKLI
jgi:adenylate kinase